MTLSIKKEKLYSESLYQARKSDLLFKHGCIATYGGKIIAKGHNTYKSYSGNDDFIDNQCSCHAEMGVMRRICYNNREKKHKLNRIMKKTTLYISRFSAGGKSTNSAPCVKCLNIIKEYNIRKIIFCFNDEYFEYNSKDYFTEHINYRGYKY